MIHQTPLDAEVVITLKNSADAVTGVVVASGPDRCTLCGDAGDVVIWQSQMESVVVL